VVKVENRKIKSAMYSKKNMRTYWEICLHLLIDWWHFWITTDVTACGLSVRGLTSSFLITRIVYWLRCRQIDRKKRGMCYSFYVIYRTSTNDLAISEIQTKLWSSLFTVAVPCTLTSFAVNDLRR